MYTYICICIYIFVYIRWLLCESFVIVSSPISDLKFHLNHKNEGILRSFRLFYLKGSLKVEFELVFIAMALCYMIFQLVAIIFSCNCNSKTVGYELSWVRVVLGTSCLGYESSWVRVVVGTSCPGYELSWVRVVLGTSCLGYELSIISFLRSLVVWSRSTLEHRSLFHSPLAQHCAAGPCIDCLTVSPGQASVCLRVCTE